ncbi:hypothetical protein D3C87_460280 [compost metagenome]
MTSATLVLNTVSVRAANGTLTDRSGTITTGGTSQTLMAANPARRGWRIQNISTGDLWFNDLGGAAAVATPGSFKIAPGGYFETSFGGISTTAIRIVGATTGQGFSASEW